MSEPADHGTRWGRLARQSLTRRPVRYLFGLAMTASALGFRLLLSPWTGRGAPFVLFFGAMLLTSLVAGVGPGLFVLLVSLPMAAVTFAIPAGATASQAAFQSLLYAVDGLIVLELTRQALQARGRLQHANHELEAAAARLERSEALARRIIELAPDAYFQADAEGRYLDANQAACRLLGYERDELLRKRILDVIPPEDAQRLWSTRTELSKPDAVHVGEWTLLRKDGTPVPVELSSNILPDGHWQAFIRDITKRRRAEDERQVYISLLENSSDFIGIADPTGTPVYVNPAGRRMVGLPLDLPAEQTRIPDYYSADQRAFAEEVILKAMLEQGRWSGETAFRHWQTGASIPVSDEHFLIRDPSGARILGMGTVIRDISHARQAAAEREQLLARERAARGEAEAINERLRESEERFRLTIEEAPIGMALVALDGRFVRVNKALCDILGYTVEELERLNYQEITPAEDLEASRALRERVMRGEVPKYQIEKRYLRKDGTAVMVCVNGSVMRDAEGSPLHYIAQIEDITERKRAEEVVRASEAKFRRLVEGMPDGVFISQGGRVVYANHRFGALLGYEDEGALLGRSVEQYVAPESLEVVRARIRRVQETRGSAPPQEVTMLRRDGSRAVVETVGIAADLEGAPAIVVVVRDLAERVRAEQALRFSEAKFSGIVSISAEAIISIDEQQKITVFNTGAETIFGYSREEVLGAPLDLLLPAALRAGHRRDVDAFATGEVAARQMGERHVSIRGRRKSGEEFPAEASIANLKVGETRLMTVVLRDVTERVRVEREQGLLAEVGGALAATLDYEQTLAAVARIAVKDFADWCMVEVMNPGEGLRRLKVASADPAKAALAEELENVPLDRARPYVMKPVVDSREPLLVPRVTPARIEAAAQGPDHLRMLRALEATSLLSVPLVLREQLLGTLTFVSSRASRLFGPADLRLATAIAERATLAIENARLYRAALQATTLRDQVLSVVAHDLRNPLSSIALHASALARPRPQPERRHQRHKEAIERAARRMNRLIQDLLDVAVLESSGRLNVEKAALAPSELVGEAVDMQRALAAASTIDLRLQVAVDVPRILGDHDRLLQVFDNLIGNALKFTEAGGQVTVGVAPSESGALFWVADTGRGMSHDELARVFDRFWQASARSGRLGAGLGLPITKGIVEAHGGRIWVESEPGRGSAFFFTVPDAPAHATRGAEVLH